MGQDNQGGDLRANVVKLCTSRCAAYEQALADGGSIVSTGAYTIKSDVLFPAPRPDVALDVYSDAADGVQATEVVQAVYRNSGVTLTDTATGQPYTQFTFYVLARLEVPGGTGGVVNCFTWAADPEAAGLQPPYDPAAGVQGFDFNADWTSVPV